MPGPPTFYANVVNVKTTQNELVLEFGAVFPDVQLQGKAVQFEPEARVVLSLSGLRAFANVLQQAVAQVEQVRKEATSPQSEPTGTTSKQ